MKKSIIPKIIIIAFFFVLIYIFKQIGIQDILYTISKANLFWVFICFASIFMMFLFWTIRWKFLLKSRLSLKTLFTLNLAGIFISTVTPTAGAGGVPLRSYYVSKLEKRPVIKTFVITLLDKLVFNNLFFGVAILASLLYVFLAIKIPIEIKTTISVLFFILIAAVLIAFALKANWHIIKKILKRILLIIYSINFIKNKFKSFDRFKNLFKRSAVGLFKSSKESLTSKRIFIPAALYTILAWFFFYLSFYVLFLAIGVTVNIAYLFIIVTISKVIGDLSFIPGGIGITESLMLGLFMLFPVSPVAAASVTIMQRGLTYFYHLVLGYISFSYFGLKNNSRG